jgi:Xaa-Pro aminopeptidase
MDPDLTRAYSTWDRGLLPLDEFGERVGAVQREMARAGLGALVVFGSVYDYGDSCYLTGIPGGSALAAGSLVLGLTGEPVIVSGGSGLELPFQKTLTWVQDFRVSGGGPVGPLLRSVIDEKKSPDAPLGTVGLRRALVASAQRATVEALATYNTRSFEAELWALREVKRPREVLVMAEAQRIAATGVTAAQEAFASGASNAEAAVAAEGAARAASARETRILANIGGDELRPYEGRVTERRSPLVVYCAAEYQGYWGEATRSSQDDGSAARVVEVMRAAAKPGARARDLAQVGIAALAQGERERAMGYGFGGGIGLALAEPPRITLTSDDVLAAGGMLALHALLPASAASAVVQV